MLKNIEVLTHSSIRIDKEKVIYIDPYDVNKIYNDADIIFITHSHYDHYSPIDIDKVKKEDTIYVVPKEVALKLQGKDIKNEQIITVTPGDFASIDDISFMAIAAYNVNKKFHPKENEWVGYIIKINDIKIYIAGDTDITEENKKVQCDIAFVPVGGTYTMTSMEAARLVNIIRPKIAVPIHYGSIVGTKEDAIDFVESLDDGIKGEILMKD